MTLWRRLRSWLDATLRRSRLETNMDAELRFHHGSLRRRPRQSPAFRAKKRCAGHAANLGASNAPRKNAGTLAAHPSWNRCCRTSATALRALRNSPGFTADRHSHPCASASVPLPPCSVSSIGCSSAVFPIQMTTALSPWRYGALRFPRIHARSRFCRWSHRITPFEFMTAVYPGSVDCDLTEQNPIHLNCGQVDSNLLPTLRF